MSNNIIIIILVMYFDEMFNEIIWNVILINEKNGKPRYHIACDLPEIQWTIRIFVDSHFLKIIFTDKAKKKKKFVPKNVINLNICIYYNVFFHIVEKV